MHATTNHVCPFINAKPPPKYVETINHRQTLLEFGMKLPLDPAEPFELLLTIRTGARFNAGSLGPESAIVVRLAGPFMMGVTLGPSTLDCQVPS